MRAYLWPMQRLAVLDNIDSFTHNLVHRLEPMVEQVIVIRNDDPKAMNRIASCDALLLSPGPGLPEESGCLMDVLDAFHGKMPILGICLGMQALAQHAGARLLPLSEAMHGRVAHIQQVNGSPDWLAGISLPLDGGLSHSWAVDDKTLPDSILPQAWSHQGVLMALSIPDKKSVGLQFHPESVMTPDGDTILQAWVNSLS